MFYGNVDGFKEYFTARGKVVPEEWDNSKIESALLVSSEWLDYRFEDSWIGYKVKFDQERSWPRQSAVVQSFPYHVYKTDEIPEQVVKATYEAAFRELTKQGSLQVDFTPNKYKSVSVSGAISVEYNSLSYASDVQIEIPVIEDLMSVLTDSTKSGAFSSVSGKVSRV